MNKIRLTVYICALALGRGDHLSRAARGTLLANRRHPHPGDRNRAARGAAGGQATYRLLAVDSSGERSDFEPKWSYCRTSKPISDNRVGFRDLRARARSLPFLRTASKSKTACPRMHVNDLVRAFRQVSGRATRTRAVASISRYELRSTALSPSDCTASAVRSRTRRFKWQANFAIDTG